MKLLFLFIVSIFHYCQCLYAQEYHVWSEFISPKVVSENLALLKQNKVTLHVAIHQNDFVRSDKFKDYVELLKLANEQGISVYLWPLLSEETGPWPNINNIDEFENYVKDLFHQLSIQNVKFKGVSFDLEPDPQFLMTISGYLKKIKLKKALKYANAVCKSNSDIRKRENFKVKLENLIQLAHQNFISTHIVTTPFLLDDLKRSGDKFQRLMGIPLVFSAKEYSFMVYRSEYQNFLGKISSDLIYQYALIQKDFLTAKKNSIDLGYIGDINFPHFVKGYHSAKELLPDIEASIMAGVTQVNLYSLDGVVKSKQPQSWFKKTNGLKIKKSYKWKLFQGFIDTIYSRLCTDI